MPIPVWWAALAAAGVGSLGALLTRLGPWYYRLNKPPWQPPDWLFGPAWTLIFALCALAGVMYWRRISRREDRQLLPDIHHQPHPPAAKELSTLLSHLGLKFVEAAEFIGYS